jgi:hypothetical protein
VDFVEVKEYPVWELERKSLEVLAQYLPGAVTTPIDIELLAERGFGLGIVPIPSLYEAYQVEGALWREPEGNFSLVVDSNMMDNKPHRYRFTVAEEIAHFILHRQVFDTVHSMDEAVEFYLKIRNYDRMDRNAKRLAAALLMPRNLLSEDAAEIYKKIVAAVGFDNPEAIKKSLVGGLSKKYEVSPMAMRIRLGEYTTKIMDRVEQAIEDRCGSLGRF